MLKQIKKEDNALRNIKDVNIKTLVDEDNIMEWWREHLNVLLEEENTNKTCIDNTEIMDKETKHRDSRTVGKLQDMMI